MSNLTFFEPELYHSAGPAYFGTLVRRPTSGGETRLIGKCHPVTTLTEWLHLVRHSPWDTYISQGEFSRSLCRISTLKTIGLVWVDIDNKHLASINEADAVRYLLQVIDEIGVPAPSLIMASGNGYHVKWLFESAVARESLMRWSELERAITAALKEIGGDTAATDASRLLRVAETTNNKNGFVARVVHVNDPVRRGEPIRYDFEHLYYEVMPEPKILTPEEDARLNRAPRPFKRAAIGLSRDFSPRRLWWLRTNDIRTVWDDRGWTRFSKGAPPGCRDLALFICAVGVSYMAQPSTWWHEIISLASELCPSLPRREWEHFVKPAYKRLLEVKSNKPGTKGRYRLTNDYIIDRLGITRDEMAKLKTIVSSDVAAERERERTRESTAKLQKSAETRSAKALRNEEVIHLAAQGKSLREIAKEIGVGRMTVQRILSMAACRDQKRGKPRPLGRGRIAQRREAR